MRHARHLARIPLHVIVAMLCAAGAARAANVTLRWTAPGDDGSIGRATAYDLRRSNAPITAATFASATPVTGVPTPAPAGARDSFRVDNLSPDVAYYFALRARDEASNWSEVSNVVMVRNGAVAGVPDGGPELAFGPAVPNPARGPVRLALALAAPGWVRVNVYDATGRRVRTVFAGSLPAGRRDLTWDLKDDTGDGVPAGWYAVRAESPGRAEIRRVLVVR